MSDRSQFCLLKLSILLTCFVWIYVESLIAVTDRGNVSYINKKYFKSAFVNVRRYGRKSPYYASAWGETKQTLGNDFVMDIIFKEYLHNEYRRSFVEFHYKFCDFVNKEPYIGLFIKNKNLPCPLPPGNFSIMNVTGLGQNFPNVFPFNKGRVDFAISVAKTKELAVEFHFVVTFIQKN